MNLGFTCLHLSIFMIVEVAVYKADYEEVA